MVSLTQRDLKLFDAIVASTSIKEAAHKVGMTTSAAYNRGRRIRNDVLFYRTYVNRVLSQSRRSDKLKKFIWPKVYSEIAKEELPEQEPE